MHKNTGLMDINGKAVMENMFLLADDGYYANIRLYHYVFWDSDMFCYSTIKFCQANPKLDTTVNLHHIKHLNPEIAERPKWITKQRIYDQLKYHNPTAAAQILNSKT